jgi:tetratricopeptide (TPR) repeat protein
MRTADLSAPSDVAPPALPGAAAAWRRHGDRWLAGILEALVIALVCISPWVPETRSPFFLYGTLGLLLAIWGGRLLLQGRIVWHKCPVTLCLALLFLSGIWQLIPFSRPVLSTVTPGTAALYERLLPAEPEIIPGDPMAPSSRARWPLSLNPQATRNQVMELLAVFLLFIMVRNNVKPASGLRRLSLAVCANGTLLALYGLVQFFNSYGAGLVEDAGLGPFLNREHFASYLNLALGLGVGVVLSHIRRNAWADAPADRPTSGNEEGASNQNRARFNVPALGVSVGLAIILGGLAFAFSPGGLVAVGAAAWMCGLLLFAPSGRKLGLALASLTGFAVLAGWLGRETFEPLLSLWSRVLLGAQGFPLWGTGFGTFSQAAAYQGLAGEMTASDFGAAPSAFAVALVEGGLLRLVLSILAMCLVMRLGYRAFRQNERDRTGSLALGALFGFITLVIHSFFVSHFQVAGISMLAAVSCAYLCGLGGDGPPAPSQWSVRLGGLATAGGALLLLILGVVLLRYGRRAQLVQEYASEANLSISEDRASQERQLRFLEALVQLVPGDANFRAQLARAHLQAFREKLDFLKGNAAESTPVLFAAAMGGSMEPTGFSGAAVMIWWVEEWQHAMEKEKGLMNEHLLPAWRHLVEARNLSPLNPKPHLGIAGFARRLTRADAPGMYLARATLLASGDPRVWYQCGLQQREDGEIEAAWCSWKRSLQLSDAYLQQILVRCRDHLSPEEMVLRVLAPRPSQLAAAADFLFPEPAERKERHWLLQKALELLDEKPEWRAKDFHLAAGIYRTTDQVGRARIAFEKALALQPQEMGWRYEFARFLYEQDQYEDAESQLLILLELEPGYTRAQDLLARVREKRRP